MIPALCAMLNLKNLPVANDDSLKLTLRPVEVVQKKLIRRFYVLFRVCDCDTNIKADKDKR